MSYEFRCSTQYSLAFVLICIIIDVVLLVLFIKPKPRMVKSRTSYKISVVKCVVLDKIVVLGWSKIGVTIAGDANSQGKNASQLSSPRDLALDWQENLRKKILFNI